MNQGQKVGEVGVWEESVWRWSLRWRRERFEWESMLEEELFRNREVKDIQVWGSDDSGLFLVKSAYGVLASHARGRHNDLFTCLWKIKTLPNVVTMTWRVLLDRIPTRMSLSS